MTIAPLNGLVPGEVARDVSAPITSVHLEPATTLLECARLTSAFVTVRVHVPSIGSGGGAAVAAATTTASASAIPDRTISFMYRRGYDAAERPRSSRRDECARSAGLKT